MKCKESFWIKMDIALGLMDLLYIVAIIHNATIYKFPSSPLIFMEINLLQSGD